MKLQAIADISEICARKGITRAILSPGSRCAPLTLAFARNPRIKTYSISDERSAAFIGLGMAQYFKSPVVLVCTSGSAAYNYAPAIAEAYYRRIPLLVLTADRPPEWIDQWDGQTIRQQDIYGKHIKKSFQLPVAYDHSDEVWHAGRIVSEAINHCKAGAPGPVHINIPLREPFYPENDETYAFSTDLKVIEEVSTAPDLEEQQWSILTERWRKFDKILIIRGQADSDPKIQKVLNSLLRKHKYAVVGDTVSNLSTKDLVTYQDIFLGVNDHKRKAALQPDLLITFGQSLISKNLKLFLREFKPKAHWHITPFEEVGDPFQTLTKVIRAAPERFFKVMGQFGEKEAFQKQKEENYFNLWQIENRKAGEFIHHFFPRPEFGEFEAIKNILSTLPKDSDLHLANSMTVRYANLLGKVPEGITVYANRGTSGIDGSSSTAVGTALASGRPTTLITGDMAFFYDRNAFWHNYPLPNLRVIVLNNHGGGIFRLIKGPSAQAELEEYFETKQQLNAKNTADDFGFEYLYADSAKLLKEGLKDFFEDSHKPKLLEIVSNSRTNQEIFNHFRKLINNNYGQ